MRPNKQINPGAHRTGTASRGKDRYYTSSLPQVERVPSHEFAQHSPESVPPPPLGAKYVGRASVGPQSTEDDAAVVVDLTRQQVWVDPLDQADDIDLATITIDLRETMVENPPETYYQRLSSRIPGRE